MKLSPRPIEQTAKMDEMEARIRDSLQVSVDDDLPTIIFVCAIGERTKDLPPKAALPLMRFVFSREHENVDKCEAVAMIASMSQMTNRLVGDFARQLNIPGPQMVNEVNEMLTFIGEHPEMEEGH